MLTFRVLNSDGSPAVGITVTVSVPGKKLNSLTDEMGNVSFDIEPQRGSISINQKPLFYGYLDVDAFQLPSP